MSLKKIALILIFFPLCGLACQKYNQTQINLKEVQQDTDSLNPRLQREIQAKKRKAPPKEPYIARKQRRYGPPPATEAEAQQRLAKWRKKHPQSSSPPVRKKYKAYNVWAGRLVVWANDYARLAKRARDLRYLAISENLSEKAKLWADRALWVDADTAGNSVPMVQKWVDNMALPPIPIVKPKYFLGQDNYEAIKKAGVALRGVEDRVCAMDSGLRWMKAIAELDLATQFFEAQDYRESTSQLSRIRSTLLRIPKIEIKCPDLDKDRIKIPLDRCPLQAEDFDFFEDKDGCPELDNDADSFPDLKDQCPQFAEIINEFEDLDGCPDAIAGFNDIFAGPTARIRNTNSLIRFLTELKQIQGKRPKLYVLISAVADLNEAQNVELLAQRQMALKKKWPQNKGLYRPRFLSKGDLGATIPAKYRNDQIILILVTGKTQIIRAS